MKIRLHESVRYGEMATLLKGNVEAAERAAKLYIKALDEIHGG